MKKRFFTMALATVFLLTASFSAAFCSAEGEKQIAKIEVRGNSAISSTTIENKLKIKVGDVFQETALNKELKRLYATGYFSDVYVETKDNPEGVTVIITVTEKPLIDKIEIRGNTKVRTGKLQEKMATKEGILLDFNLLSQDVNTIRNYYVDQGYSNVSVDYRIETDRDTGKTTVAFVIDEGTPIKITRILFEGNKSFPSGELQKYMSTKTAWWFIRKGAYAEEQVETDVNRLKTFYRTKGFLDVQIDSRAEYNPDGKTMTLLIIVDEGKKYLIGDINIEGSLAFPEKEIADLVTLKSGDAFDYSEIRANVDNIRSFYYAKGYMNAEVELKHKYNPKTDRMDVLFTIEAHDEVYVGKINILGNTKTKDKVIRRELRVYPGLKYDGTKMKKSKERIYNLGFFEDVYFDTVPSSDPDVKDLNVTVKETKTGEFSFGGGYSSVDAFIGFVQIKQRNFDITNFPTFMGGGQDLTIRAELGSSRSDYLLSWTDPWVFGYPYLFGFDVYRHQTDRSGHSGYGYDETRTGGDLRFGKEITDEIYTGLTYTLEEVKISNVPDDATDALRKELGSNWISSISWDTQYDTRDNRYSPRKGILAGVKLENAGGIIGGDKSFVKGYAHASYYHSFLKEFFVLELKVRGGAVQNYGDSDEVPIYERFFAGGGTTIRGYKERGVGPRDRGTNTALGGESMLIGNAEVTFPIWQNLIKGAVFYDVGNVWEEFGNKSDGAEDDNGFKMGTGVGVGVKTPIGPVKLDYGYPLSDNYDDKKEGQFYFSVSHGF